MSVIQTPSFREFDVSNDDLLIEKHQILYDIRRNLLGYLTFSIH